MATTIMNVRSMHGMGIFADRDARATSLQFRSCNLIYGFNGSGKSTLSRLFASLQSGSRHHRLPPSSTFEIELDNGTILSCPDKLEGLERRVLVFNSDFVEQNLQWSMARANPIFYIGLEQAELAAELARCEADASTTEASWKIKSDVVKIKEKSFALFKRERARVIAECMRLRGRKYEAPQLANDYENTKLDDALLGEEELEGFRGTCRLDKPMSKLSELALLIDGILKAINDARSLSSLTPLTGALDELERHPSMLLWIKQGHQYHTANNLGICLFCNSLIGPDRKEILEHILDDRFNHFLSKIDEAVCEIESLLFGVTNSQVLVPNSDSLSVEMQVQYKLAVGEFINVVKIVENMLINTAEVLTAKRVRPTLVPDISKLPVEIDISKALTGLVTALGAVNAIIQKHNQNIADFDQYQEMAQASVRKHYLAEGADEYEQLKREYLNSCLEADSAKSIYSMLQMNIQDLRGRIKKHGPAAAKMNKLIQSYLGHAELTILPVGEGYEIHRHGKLIEGFPSEGEKTAIALCYFLCILESEGRKLKDLIVVIDDPISSLDTKALNFACTLVKSRLSGAKQLFVFTHNQNCMNEFRKAWKNKITPRDGKEPAATFLFIDVSIPKGQASRTSSIVEVSRLLREYDSEYHFLFYHVLKFSEAEDGEYEYAYMMPNVLRRVLDVFLAFKCPGSAGLATKIGQLCKSYDGLDIDRVTALERLAQAESHSDNLDDLISFSSMALEETKDANISLLYMMEHVDKGHLDALREICK
jgi:wobble nucleotide-excising tRNase